MIVENRADWAYVRATSGFRPGAEQMRRSGMPENKTNKLVGHNYTTPDLIAKVTGKAKYAEDYRVEGMLFAKLLLSPMPHARVVSIDASEALAMPGVKAILTADDLPTPADGMTDMGQVIPANKLADRSL